MAHRKHLSQEGHAEPEKTNKKAAATNSGKNAGKTENKSKTSKSNYGKGSLDKDNAANSHIKDEHGEY